MTGRVLGGPAAPVYLWEDADRKEGGPAKPVYLVNGIEVVGTPQNGYVLTYNSATGQAEWTAPSGGGGGVSILGTDVIPGYPTVGGVLTTLVTVTFNAPGTEVLAVFSSDLDISVATGKRAVRYELWLDGVSILERYADISSGTSNMTIDISVPVTVTPGSHTIDIKWVCGGGGTIGTAGFPTTLAILG